ncbi:MAG: transporter substrate-binding domain-containing protein [Azonexus sp.]|jgi:ABC-type amino acid transport substrate-binding protein|nr:transporter substrate-binding domain-containing protein [Azonexus sp.]
MRRLSAALCLTAILALPPSWVLALSSAPLKVVRVALVKPGARINEAHDDLRAFNEDMVREICQRMTVRCRTRNVRFGNILPGVVAGHFDLGFGNFLRTPERERQVDFSSALWHSSSRLVGRSEQAADSDLYTLREARLVAVAGSQQLACLQRLTGERGLVVISAPTMADAFALVRDGKADFALLPVLGAYILLVGEPGGSYRFFGETLVADGLGGSVHVIMSKRRPKLRQAVGKAIVGMRRDGSYERLVRQHFPFSVD